MAGAPAIVCPWLALVTAVLALVSAHVGGVTLAHDRALASYRSTQDAMRSQYWMLVAMVGFTSLGLWLLSAVNT